MKEIYIIVGIIVAVIIAISLAATIDPPRIIKTIKTVKESYAPTDFLIYNHLPMLPIKVNILVPDADGNFDNSSTGVTLIEKIEPKKTKGLTKEQVIKYLVGGNLIRIYAIRPSVDLSRTSGLDAPSITWGKTAPLERHYTDYLINTPDNTRLKALHVGMITTRFMLDDSLWGLRSTTTAGNAVGGNAFLRIHNLSSLPLRLNDDAEIAPHSVFTFTGYRNQGVSLGYIFKDVDGLYPDYQYLQPYSDLYYGVVSDLEQPINGCAQPIFTDSCEYGQTLWPFEEGIL